jgi:hypothetical protein
MKELDFTRNNARGQIGDETNFKIDIIDLMKSVATPLWPSVGVKPNTWKSWELGVLRDSRMFRAR